MWRRVLIITALAALLAALALFWLWESPSAGVGVGRQPSAPAAEVTPARAEAEGGPAAVLPREARTRAAGPAEDASAPTRQGDGAQETGEPRTVTGRVLDPTGAPLGDVAVVGVGGAVLARSLADGGFSLVAPPGRVGLEGRRADFTTVRRAIVPAEFSVPQELLVVMAPAVDLAGRVVDRDGRGIPEVHLRIQEYGQGLVGFPLPLDGTEEVPAESQSEEEGLFRFPSAPRIPGRPLALRRSGYKTLEVEVPELSTDDLVLVLEDRPTADKAGDGRGIFGVVQLADGAPAAGARVQLERSSALADRDGRFELTRSVWTDEDALLVAMLAGWQPAVWGEIGPPPEPGASPLGPLVLTLSGPALALAGRVEERDGKPAADWRLRLLDPTILDHGQTPAPIAENVGETEPSSRRTDAQGRFELTGLADRAYSVRVWHPETYVAFDAGPFQAGARDLTLRVPEDAAVERLEGRVVSRGGVPVQGVTVAVQFPVHSTRSGQVAESVAGTTTDAEGRFELFGVPRRHSQLIAGGDDVLWTTYEPPGGELDGRPVVIEVERLAHVRLDFSSLEPLPEGLFQFLDASGAALAVESRSAGGRMSTTHPRLQGGRSAVMVVSELAATLVVARGDGEPLRRPVVLVPGTVNELGP